MNRDCELKYWTAGEMRELFSERGQSAIECARLVGCSPADWIYFWSDKNCGNVATVSGTDALNPMTTADASCYGSSAAPGTYPQVSDKADPSGERFEIAVISDTHFGSKQQQLTFLSEFVRLCQERNIRTLLHGGDVSEGLMPRHGAKNERFIHTIDESTEYCIDVYPEGFDNSFIILGNHDDSMGRRLDGFDIGAAIQRERSDLTYLKSDPMPDMVTVDGGLKVQLFHGSGGCGKFRSTRAQNKSIELIGMLRRPHLLALGHCHIASMVPNYIGMYVYGLGAFQSQTSYIANKGLTPDICGLIFGYKINEIDGSPMNVTTEFVYATDLGGVRKFDW